jgi:hypothetical protein
MAAWFWYAVVAAVLYGAHQIFTRFAAECIGEGLDGFIVEASAAMSILIYLAILWFGEDGIRNSVDPVLVIRCLPASASAPTRSHFSCCLKRRTALFCPGDSRGWRGDHGHRRYFVFSRSAVVAAPARGCPRDCRTISPPALNRNECD